MSVTLLHNAEIVNEGRRYRGYVLTDGQLIVRTGEESTLPADGPDSLNALRQKADTVIDCGGGMLMPGVIDTHVHFRDPGLTEKESHHTSTCQTRGRQQSAARPLTTKSNARQRFRPQTSDFSSARPTTT
ncbi:hypothetical protein [uncultured Duncaniella sp.]|uniref:hypothetical protein n=1 Tax=uncultured Duncaniella sp. TaxID=2768039 RepID=UPI002732BAEB|nr:hypothetical protein [uncultured Duncaniella sp.]